MTVKPGRIMRDFHTAKSEMRDNPYVTHRLYLEDAVFLAGLEGERELLLMLEAALLSPYFPLFLGRRSCPPTGQLCLGIREASLADALRSEAKMHGASGVSFMAVAVDAEAVGNYRQRDVPVSFDPEHRKFAYRYLIAQTTHDAFGEVE